MYYIYNVNLMLSNCFLNVKHFLSLLRYSKQNIFNKI